MDFLKASLTALADAFGRLPPDIVGLLLMLFAILVALSIHRWVRRLVRHFLALRHPYIFSVFVRMRGVTQFALVIFAISAALSIAPFSPGIAALLGRLMLIATICLIGWSVITALNLAADLYLRRFNIQASDNLLARKHFTQVRVLLRALYVLVVLFTIGAALMTFESVRQYGVSLFASAGVAGLVAGLAARPLLSNLFAGMQLAMTQPIRIDDVVIVENEWGTIEEIRATYVVVKLWDLRRMVVPLTYFIEKPFQNWTREGAAILGPVVLYLDYSAPIDLIRAKAREIAERSPLWNGEAFVVQVTDTKESVIEVRILVSSNNAGAAFDLRCDVREQLIDFLQREHPYALPRRRQEIVGEVQRRGNGRGDKPAERHREPRYTYS